jgi:hypothetical protein
MGGELTFMCPCIFHQGFSIQQKQGGMEMALPPVARLAEDYPRLPEAQKPLECVQRPGATRRGRPGHSGTALYILLVILCPKR